MKAIVTIRKVSAQCCVITLHKSKLICVLIFVGCLLSACITKTPQDLEISRIGLIQKDKLNPLVDGSIHKFWIESDFMIVELSTATNLVQYANYKGYPLSFDGRFCDRKEVPLFTFGLYSEKIGDSTELIDLDGIELNNISLDKISNKFSYYAIVPITFFKDIEIYGRPEREGAVFYGKYNLETDPSDLCFRVGGTIYGVGFESNIAILAKSVINKITK